MNSYRLSLCGGQQAADRTSEPFMAFGIHCHILYFIIFGAQHSEKMLLFFSVWFEGPKIMAQFLFHSDNVCTESQDPKECPQKIWSMFF